MLVGLRPRLKTRPSLLDLIQKKDIDQISVSPPPVVEATRVPLPASPQPQAQRELSQPPPPRITLQEDSEEESRTEAAAKMPPVSFAIEVRRYRGTRANGGATEEPEEAGEEGGGGGGAWYVSPNAHLQHYLLIRHRRHLLGLWVRNRNRIATHECTLTTTDPSLSPRT